MTARDRASTLFVLAIAVALIVAGCGGGGGVTSGCPPNCGTPPPTNPPTPPPPASVTGKVVQYGTSTGLVGATVKLGSLTTVSDASGNYSFPNVALLTSPTVLYLQISASSYATANTGAQIVSGANLIRTIALLQPNATEQTWLGQVNTDRGNNGAAPVAFDEAAMEGARLHANDMAAQGYVSHWDTNGELPFARYCQVGGVAGDTENAAGGFATTAAAEAAFMSDATHKANIIDPNHQWVGLGAVLSGAYDQEFVSLGMVYDPTVIGSSVGAGSNHTFYFRAVAAVPGLVFVGATPLPTHLTPAQLNAPPYNDGYGDLPGMNVPFSVVPGDATLVKVTYTFATAQQYLISSTFGNYDGMDYWLEAH